MTSILTGRDRAGHSKSRMMRSEQLYAATYPVKWRAEALAGCGRERPYSPFSVPSDWTAWLLMEKAGLPRRLIAELWPVPADQLARKLRIVKALLIFPPFAARIEALMQHMPRFDDAKPTVPEAACAALAE